MWPDSKGKGGKDNSPKSKDGGDTPKSNSGSGGPKPKNRNTKTKMKALSADAIASAEQAKAASDKLEQEIIKAAQSLTQAQAKAEETKTLIEVNRVPESAVTAVPPVHYDQNNRGPAAQPRSGGTLPGTSFRNSSATPAVNQGGSPSDIGTASGTSSSVSNAAVGGGYAPPAGETGTSAGLMRLSESGNENMEDKISGLWKSRVLGAYRANPRASQHILPAMPNNRGNLEVTDKARIAAQQEAMISVVDKMFDRFQNLAFEFNNVARGSDLELTWIRPIITKENISSWHQAAQVVSVFTGRISTRLWTMVVRGTQDSVLAYCIPADKLLTFGNQPANFQPVIELIPVADGLTVRWKTMDRFVSPDDLVNIYRALLDNMIRIAQNDAPSECLIDLPSYGVFLDGNQVAPSDFNQVNPQSLGTELKYSANQVNQQAPVGFAAQDKSSPFAGVPTPMSPAGQAPSMGGQFAAGPAPAPVDDGGGWKSADTEDWKPVVRNVRGANPADAGHSSASSQGASSPAAAGGGPGEWKTEPYPSTSSSSSSPSINSGGAGFNQDEPWKYSVPGAGSSAGFSSGGSGSFGGDRDDERPLPSLPAHLFEGLPPRPQAAQNAAASSPSPSAPSVQPAPSGWGAPPGAQSGAPSGATSPFNNFAGPAGGQAATGGARAVGNDSSDGWKKADAPKGAGSSSLPPLPPLPVSNYGVGMGNAFISEPAPLSNSLVTPESFTSGSIRVDALAREIAQAPMALPSAVPGFEPYSVVDTPPEFNAFITPEPDVVEPAADDAEVAALFEGEPVNSNNAANPGNSANTGLKNPSAPVDEPDFGNTFNFGRTHTDDLPWPPGTKKRADLDVDLDSDIDNDDFDEAPQASAETTSQGYKSADPFTQDNFAASVPALDAAPDMVADNRTESKAQNAPESSDSVSNSASASAIEAGFRAARQAASSDSWQSVHPQDGEPGQEQNTGQSSDQNSDQYLNQNQGNEELRQQQHPPDHDQEYSPELEPEQEPGHDLEAGAYSGQGEGADDALGAGAVEAAVGDFPDATDSTDAGSDFSAVSSVPSVIDDPWLVSPRAQQQQPPLNIVPPQVMSYSSLPAVASQSQSAMLEGQRSLKSDIDRLLSTLDIELEAVTNKGSEAFARRDLKGAERLIKLAETLSDFKESLGKLKEEHGGDLS